ncbi:hypothetical protein BASA81_012430 [Batrachochytrium salamandrivorans]|nr:hypothetical protein BASA81_012430 [Batrachochytrium salamandrivorans]
MILDLEQRLEELSLRTFEKNTTASSRSLASSFNALQHVDALWHVLTDLVPSEFVGASALLFSKSFPHNLLDFISLALKSHELSKDLVDERTRLYECLEEFIKRSGSWGVQDHLQRLSQFTEYWIKAENSSKTLVACLKPLQAALDHSTVSFKGFGAGKLASVLKERYLYGKANESYSPTVKGALLTTLGLLCSRCPQTFEQREVGMPESTKESLGDALRRLCIACLDGQLKSGDPNLALVSGTFSGLRFLLVGSPCQVGPDSQEANQIYSCIRHLMTLTKEVKRFEIPFQAISLLRAHSRLFASQLILEPEVLFDDLRMCVHSKNDKIKQVAMPCCLEVLRTIAKCLDGGEEEDEEEGDEDQVTSKVPVQVLLELARKKTLLNLFMKRFSEYIQTGLKQQQQPSDADVYAMRRDVDLAICGFGCFAKTIKQLTDEARLSQVLFKLFELSDRLKSMNALIGDQDDHNPYRVSSKLNAKLFQRIRFLATYGKIAKQLSGKVLEDELVLDRLQHDVLSIQTDFSSTNLDRANSSPHEFNYAVEQVLAGLANKGACLPELLARIIRPLLLHSLRAVRKDDEGEEGDETFVYDPLWRKLLPSPIRGDDEDGKKKQKTKEETFHTLISVALQLIPELNLECIVVGAPTAAVAVEDEEQNMTPSYLLTKTSDCIVPRSVEDLKQFHLLALFLQRHKPVTDQYLVHYLPMFTRIVSNGLDRNPLISSWYRLMSLAFSCLDCNSTLDMDASTLQCLDVFLETTCLRANQYQDELLCASLTCVLQCPQGPLLDKHMRNLANCIVTALRVGLSHAPLAELAMGQLERWIAVVQDRQLLVDVVLPIVLPELAGYLTSSESGTVQQHQAYAGGSGDGEDEEPLAATQQKHQSAMLEQDEELIRRWRASHKRTKRKRAVQAKEKTPLNIRAVRLLGSVGGHNRLVLPRLETVLIESKSWDPVKRVELSLPLGQSLLLAKVDGILPRVASLATSSTHRQTKIAACELLHSLLLVMLGTSATDPLHRGGEYFCNIYTQLFPSLLQLAVDVDGVARQLFLPLVEQLSKWFARDENSSEAAALLQCVIEALGDKSNSALRELAANTLGVFFRWTFKSASSGQVAAKATKGEQPSKRPKLSLLNSTTMLYHLYSLMRHPDPFKRLGSCAAFEAFYRDFREQPVLVDEHTLLFLENSLISLRLSHYDPAALATGDAAGQVVLRIKRILMERAKDFAIPNPNRLAFEDVNAFRDWVFSLCACPETLLRGRAQELFEALSGTGNNALTSRNGLSSQWEEEQANLTEVWLDECTARVDYAWWRARKQIATVEDVDLDQTIASLISSTCRLILSHRGARDGANPRLASALCRFLRISANWNSTNRQVVLDEFWECLLVGLVYPAELGLDLEDRDYKASLPSAFHNMIRVFGSNKPEAVLQGKLDFSTKLAGIQLLSGKSENSALLRAAVMFTKHHVKLPGQDVEHLARCVYSLPFGKTSPQALKDGSVLLRLEEEEEPVDGGPTVGFTFFKHFSGDICQFLCRHPTRLGPLLDALNVTSLATSLRSSQAFYVLTTLLKDPTTRTNEQFAATFFPLLVHFSQVCLEVVPLLGQIMHLPTGEGQEELVDYAFKCLQALLTTKATRSNNQLAIKSQLVQHCLGPFLIIESTQERAADLFEREIVGHYFPPVTAAKLLPGMEDCDTYLGLLQVSMDVLVETKSLLLLRVMCHRAVREIDLPVHRKVLQQGLRQLVMAVDLENESDYMPIALECMQSLTKEASEALKRCKMALFDHLLLPLCERFATAQWEALLLAKFHREKGAVFEYLMYMIQQPLAEDTSKECCYNALRCFFRFGALEVVQRVQRAAFPGNSAGNEATKIISKQAKKLLTDEAETSVHGKTAASHTAVVPVVELVQMGEAEDLVSHFSPKERLCNAVFSCLVAVVEKTQSQAKFFDSLLFSNLGNVLHALIPDRTDHLTEPKFTVREFIVPSLAHPLSATTATSHTTTNGLAITSKDDEHNEEGKYMVSLVVQSQVAAVTQEIASNVPIAEEIAPSLPPPPPLNTLCEQDESVPLELDCLNTLPAMESFLLALDGMRKKQLIALDGGGAQELPPFVSVVLAALQDKRGSGGNNRQSLNVRLFAAKVVLNRPHLFSLFAKQLVIPLVELVVDLESAYVKQGLFRGLHSFIQDVCHVLIGFELKPNEWSALNDNATDAQSVSRLFALLFRLTRNSFQVDLCAALLQKFIPLEHAQADVRYLTNQASKAGISHHQQQEEPDTLPHAKIALALLQQCGAFGYLVKSPHTGELCQMLLGVLAMPKLSTRMAKQCAKVLASCLVTEQQLTGLLENLLNRDHEPERCLDILAELLDGGNSDSNGRAVSRDVFAQALRLLPTLEGDYLNAALDVARHSVNEGNALEVYQSLMPLLTRGKLLSADNAHVLSIASCLQLVERLGEFPVVAEKIASSALPESIADLLCHHPGASIRLRCFEYLSARPSSSGRQVLVSALSDANEQIQKRAFEYWEGESPSALPMDRLLHLLEAMNPCHLAWTQSQHHAVIRKRAESSWVCHLSQLLLAMARRSPAYKDLLFKEALNSAAFEDSGEDVPVNNALSTSQALISTPMFLNPTQQEGDSSSSFYQSQDSLMSSNNGLLVRATQQVNNAFLPTQLESQQSTASSLMMLASPASTMQRVRRRTAKQVIVLRKYRKGEVPDVQIAQKELIEPLLALCGLDAKVAFHFLVALVPVLLDGVEDQVQFAQMEDSLTRLLESKPSETMFATCLLEFFTMLAVAPGSTSEINPQLVGEQSLACKSYATGVFAIEAYILRQQQQQESSKRAEGRPPKQAKQVDSIAAAWQQLYSLYKALNETDVLLGLSERSSSSSSPSKSLHLATTLDLGGKQAQAIELYGEIIQQNESATVAMECYLARSKCFQKLRKWDDSFKELEPLAVMSDEQDLFQSNKQLLELFLRAGVHSSSQDQIDKALHFMEKHSSQTDVFEQILPVDLIQAELVRQPADWGRALDRTNRGMRRFLHDFASQPLLAVATRRVLIQPLPQFTSFLDAFTFRKLLSGNNLQKQQVLFQQLESSSPLELQDGPEVWESVYSQRLLLLTHLRDNVDANPGEFDSQMERHLHDLLLKAFSQAKRTLNFDIAKSICREMKRLSIEVFPQSPLLIQASANSSIDLVFANKQVEDYSARLTRALQLLEKRPEPSVPTYFKRLGRIHKALGNVSQAMEAFETRCGLLQSVTTGGEAGRAQAHYDLGALAEEQFNAKPFASASLSAGHGKLATRAIENLLVSYGLGNPMASNAFPRVLKLAMLGSQEQAAFKQHVAHIPTMALLKWTAQLLSVFNQSDVADCVLERIALDFPQSFVYPFRVSREAMLGVNMATRGAKADPTVKRRLDVLQRKMNLPHVVHLFCDALERLTHPELRLRDLLKQMQQLFVQSDRVRDVALANEARKIWKDKVLGEVFANTPTRGKYHTEFAKQFEAKARAEMAAGGGEEATLLGTINVIKAMPASAQRLKSGKCALNEFSAWLDNFALLGDKRMEIPGSRDPWKLLAGQAMTATVNNSVLAFDNELLVMGSMRVPKRLTIRGMDNSKHDFLVKGGEDLRLDERIEQLFGLMNRLMGLDVECTSKNQRVETYKVIPISLSCGLIEWIPNSQPIKHVIETQYAQHPSSLSSEVKLLEQLPSEKAFAEFEAKYSKGFKSPLDMYAKLYQERDEAMRDEYLKVKQSIPADLHLDNFMINSVGELVAIDFGYSFGIGVVMLPVAETLPFRFTPQFSQFLAPLSSNGTFFHCARRALTCLREGRGRMLEVMEVFVNEPLVDWVAQIGMTTSSSSSSGSNTGDSQIEAWRALSNSRVRVADLKMRGVRPSLVMSAELMERKKNAGIDDVVAAVQRSASSGKQKIPIKCSLRDGNEAKWIQETVSVPEQVEELINMATSEAMLIRQWKGSRCWV